MERENNYTTITKHNKGFLDQKPRTAKEVVEFLEQGAMYRSFPYLISELYEGDDALARLQKGICEITGKSEENVRKKTQNWMNNKNLPQQREDLFQICFILGLDEEKSNYFLGVMSENRIHYRNPSELAYAFALRTGRSYKEAVRLREEACCIFEEEKTKHKDELCRIETIRQNGAWNNKEAILYTERNKELFESVNSEEDFFAFFHENSVYLGIQHETAYAKFMELLNRLQNTDETDERKYSMEQVVEDYLRMNVPQTKQVGKMTAQQKLIKKFWPSKTALDKMKNRQSDVNRKTMILLYMITEEFDKEIVDEEEYFYCDEDREADDLFEIRRDQMDLFLNKYGMNTLDYGNPFDLIVLYSLHPSLSKTEDDFVSERMEQVMEILYEGVYVEEEDRKKQE